MPIPREVFEKIVYYRREVDRIWNEYLGAARGAEADTISAPVDVVESEDQIVIDVELPGVPAEAIEISASNDVLVIEGVRTAQDPSAAPGGRYHQAERAYGRFQRILELPRGGNLGRMQARLSRGVLEITVPKVRDRRGQWTRVPVTSDDPAPNGAGGGTGAAVPVEGGRR
jgi:HSP20 family protein